jgi:hypothetical protein
MLDSPLIRDEIRQLLGPRLTTRLRCVACRKPLTAWGNLSRPNRFSDDYDSNRGTPIHRYYLHIFLARNCADITSDVPELQGTGYTRPIGHDVRYTPINPHVQPIFVCDLAESGEVIPSNRCDYCLIPNSIQHLRSLEVPAKYPASGNRLATIASILGLASEELTRTELDLPSPRYPVLITFNCRRQNHEA